MSCATDFLRRITGTVLVLVVAVLGCLIVASAASAEPPPGLVQAHGYDAPNYDQPTTYTATQRGPPAAHVSTAVSAGQRAVDRPSYGALARSDAPSDSNYTTYDVPTSLAQVDNSTGTTARSAVAVGGDLSSLQRAQAAANAGSKLLPKVDNAFQFSGAGRSGAGVKNFVGPPNTIARGASPGRVFVTDEQGRVIFDVTRDRVKPVVPGQGFVSGDGRKLTPTAEQLSWIDELWGG